MFMQHGVVDIRITDHSLIFVTRKNQNSNGELRMYGCERTAAIAILHFWPTSCAQIGVRNHGDQRK